MRSTRNRSRVFSTAVTLLCLGAACSPRNALNNAGTTGGTTGPATCTVEASDWPTVPAQFQDYEGTGASTGDTLWNFQLLDQFGNDLCLSQFLGSVLVVDASTRWCGPCNEAAAESMELWAEMTELGPSWIITLMVQDFSGLPASITDVEEWSEQYDITYPVVLDSNEQTRQSWEVLSFPTFFFVAPTGEIVERLESRPSEEEILDFVAQAMTDYASDLTP